ncbi:MAG: class I SAM-dependent methyltransferase [Patescibacteria group bacterium]
MRGIDNLRFAMGEIGDNFHEHNPNSELNMQLGHFAIARTEGFYSAEQSKLLQQFVLDHPNITKIAEMGFNSGHTANTFLGAREDVEVTSFSHRKRRNSKEAQLFINENYPHRHTMVKGNSLFTVPKYFGSDEKFDLIYIDRGHQKNIAYADMYNGAKIASPECFVIMDDVPSTRFWIPGQEEAWTQFSDAGNIVELDRVESGNRRWVIGQYSPKFIGQVS